MRSANDDCTAGPHNVLARLPGTTGGPSFTNASPGPGVRTDFLKTRWPPDRPPVEFGPRTSPGLSKPSEIDTAELGSAPDPRRP